jgi:general secretion pathway protein I
MNMPVFKTDCIATAKRDTRSALSGFTLLEVMISLAIIAIALIAIYSTYTQTISLNVEQRFNTTAPLLAAKIVSDFESRPRDDLTDESGEFGPEFPGYTWDAVVETIASETLDTVAEDMRSIAVTISFNADEFVYRVRTIRFMRSGEAS